MGRFYAQNGQFWLDDKPILIQAGEFHYFRTPREEWRHRLGILKDAGFNAVASYIPWLWHQLEEDTSDFNGHSHPMRDLEGFLDLAAEMGLLIIARPGPYIMAETVNEGIPPWVFVNYPQASFISQDNQVQNLASYLQSDFIKCVKKWYHAIFSILTPRQITNDGKIIMVQLDNEMGMMHWVRNIFDINPDTMTRFANYLMSRYKGDLPERYPGSNLAEFLTQALSHPEETFAEKVVTDYKHFYRDYLYQYASFLWSEAQANGMEVMPVINIHGFANGGKTFPIGLSQLISVMRIDGMVSATDVYPILIGEGNFDQLLMVNEATKALHNKGQALFSIEFQSGGVDEFSNGQSSFFDLHTRLCLSSGMRAINHYLFCSGENDPILSPTKRHDWGHPVRTDGTLRRHYYRYPKLARVLNSYGTDLTIARPQTVTSVGFMLDYFMTEVNNEYTRKFTDIITHQRDVVLFDMIARGLSLTHRPFNAIELSSGELNVTETPVCWAMMDKQCNAETQRKLVDYLNNGGKLILAGRMCVEDFEHQECTILRDAVGIQQIFSDSPFVKRSINAFNYRDIPVSFVETYSGPFDETFAWLDNGDVVGFVKNVGKGKVMLFGAAMIPVTLEDVDVVHQMGLKMDCPVLFKLDHWADVRISLGKNGSFLFINNYQDDPLETTIEYNNEMMLGGNPVRIPARQGLILPIEWRINKDLLINYMTSEIIELNNEGDRITINMAQDDFFAEITTSGFVCIEPGSALADGSFIKVQGEVGKIVLVKNN